MQIKNKTLTADLMILLSALLWGGEYVIVKDVLCYMPPNWINAFRFICAALLMLPLFYSRLRKLNRREFSGGLVLGLCMFGGFTLQTIGIQYTTAGKSGFLTSTYVVIVPFIVWIFKRKFPGVKSLLSAAVLTAGVSLLSLEGGGGGFNRGDLLTLGAAFCFGCSIIGFDYYAKREDPVRLTFIEMLSSGILSLVIAVKTEPVPSLTGFGGFEIIQILYLILLGSLICHLLSNVAMKWAEPTHASILWSLESVFAMVFGIIFLQESVDARMTLGFLLVLSAVLITELGSEMASGLRKLRYKDSSVR